MFSEYVATIASSVLLFPALDVLRVIPLWISHKRHFGELHEYSAGLFGPIVFYLVTATHLTVLPLPESVTDFCAGRGEASRAQLVPIASIRGVARYAEQSGLGYLIKGRA